MSKRNRMPGLRQKDGIWHIEKRCKHAEGGWLRESTGKTGRAEAEAILIRRLAELEEESRRKTQGVYTFEEAAMRYLEDIAHKSSAETAAMHLDQLLPIIGPLPLEQVHDGTLKAFTDGETERGMAPKTINNAIGVVSAVLNRAARVWRNESGTPWLRQAPPRLTRLSTKGRQATNPTRSPGMNRTGCSSSCPGIWRMRRCSLSTPAAVNRRSVSYAGIGKWSFRTWRPRSSFCRNPLPNPAWSVWWCSTAWQAG